MRGAGLGKEETSGLHLGDPAQVVPYPAAMNPQ